MVPKLPPPGPRFAHFAHDANRMMNRGQIQTKTMLAVKDWLYRNNLGTYVVHPRIRAHHCTTHAGMIWGPVQTNGLADWDSLKLLSEKNVELLFEGISEKSYKAVHVTKLMNLISDLRKQGPRVL